VDFLPYFVIGLFAKLGVDPFVSSLLMSFGAGVLCLFIAVAILREVGLSSVTQLGGFLFLSFFPPLCFNSAQGFATTLFAAFILGTLYFYFFKEKFIFGMILASLLPLVRLEGLFLTFLLWIHFLSMTPRRLPNITKTIGIGFLLILPISILSLYRWAAFGLVVPIPVLYKSALGSAFYFRQGVRNLLTDFVVGYGLISLPIVLMGLKLIREAAFKKFRFPLLILTIFVVPYYLSGGDWFPPIWGRYLFP